MWTDELATFLFLWLAMLGAVVALRARRAHAADRRGQPGRRPHGRAGSATVAALVVIAFVLGSCCRPQRIPRDRSVRRADHAGDLRRLARRRDLVGAGADAAHRLLRLLETTTLAQLRPGARCRRRRSPRGLWLGAADADRHGHRQPDRLLRRPRRRLRRASACRSPSPSASRPCRYLGADHAHAAVRRGQPHGRGHVEPAAAVGADVRVPRPADGDDRHRARDGGVPRRAGRPCARRAVLRAAGRDVSGVRHLRLEGRRHGGGRAGAVPRDAPSRLASRRAGVAAGEPPARCRRRSRPAWC